MTLAWAQRQQEWVRAWVVFPDVCQSMGARLGACGAPSQPVLAPEAA
jgi:hypothetical protein